MVKLTIYYDGLCQLCSREIESYKKLKESQAFRFQDITADNFDAKKEGLDPYAVHQQMHVRLANGKIKTGVDAFINIWKELPGYKILVPIIQHPLIHPFAKAGYFVFAKIRRYLPKRKKDCSESPYCEL